MLQHHGPRAAGTASLSGRAPPSAARLAPTGAHPPRTFVCVRPPPTPHLITYKFPGLSWKNIRFKKWKTFAQTATDCNKLNHRLLVGLQFLAKEPEFAAFTKLQIDDKGDLADLPDYTTELYEAMTRVCAGEL